MKRAETQRASSRGRWARRLLIAGLLTIAVVILAGRWWRGPTHPGASAWTWIEIVSIDTDGSSMTIAEVSYATSVPDREMCHRHELVFPGLAHVSRQGRRASLVVRGGRVFTSIPTRFRAGTCADRLESIAVTARSRGGLVSCPFALRAHGWSPGAPIRFACSTAGELSSLRTHVPRTPEDGARLILYALLPPSP